MCRVKLVEVKKGWNVVYAYNTGTGEKKIMYRIRRDKNRHSELVKALAVLKLK